nr:MAG TPA: STNV protein [Cressdnaviricota sp.]
MVFRKFMKSRAKYARKDRAYAQSAARQRLVWTVRGLNRGTRGLMLARGELKAADVSADVACDSTGTLALLNGIARGDDINERTGRQVVMRSLQLKLQTSVTAGTGTDQVQRYMIVLDSQTNAAALTLAQVLGGSSTIAFPLLENRMRFKILYDRFVAFNATAEPGSKKTFVINKKLNVPVTFNAGDAGTVADIVSNSLYLIVLSTNAAGATAGSATYASRIRYEDK